jgi:hypothetical protein
VAISAAEPAWSAWKWGEHQPPQVSQVMAERADGGGDLRRGAGDAGVDEGQAVGVVAQVGMADRETQEVQARDQLDDVHAVTLMCPARARPGVCRTG